MNYYDLLEIPPTATQAEIRKAYHFICKRLHPDLTNDEDEKRRLEEVMKEINQAYNVLKDPEKRKIYDTNGQQEGSGVSREQNIKNTIMNFFNMAIESMTDNILGHTKKSIEDEIRKIEEIHIKTKKEVDRLKKKRDKIKTKRGKENLFQMVIDHKIRSIENDIPRMEEGLEILKECYSMLKDYKSDEKLLLRL